MTQIPEAGSEWVRNGSTVKVIYADSRSVLLEDEGGARWCFYTDNFPDRFEPAPRKIKHRRWVNLYKNGDTGGGWNNKEDAIRIAGGDRDQIAETRLIEWEVEK